LGIKRGSKSKREPERKLKLVTRRQLADALGCDPRTIAKWQDEGMPVAVKGRGGRPSRYDQRSCIAWKKQREVAATQPGHLDLLMERARKERAQAALAEQTFSMRMRDLLPRDEVEKAWAWEVGAVRTLLLTWKTTIADKLHRASALEGLPGVERVLDEAVRDVLNELADPNRPLPPDGTTPSGKAVAA
jgi:hypothetical protein